MNHLVRYVARFTLEAQSALSLASGDKDGVFDVSLVHDANGLPALPGTAIAGVLRHLFHKQHDDANNEAIVNDIFGYQHRAQGTPSRVHISFGCLQDSHGKPVEGLLLGDEAARLRTDPLLAAAIAQMSKLSPVIRDRVAINHRGVSQNFFDRTVLNAGHRFSAELTLHGTAGDQAVFDQLCALLSHPLFRLGGATRAGLGHLRCVELHTGVFDLTVAEQRDHYLALDVSVGSTAHLNSQPIGPTTDKKLVQATIKLTPETPWRFGGGDEPTVVAADGKAADLLPKLEMRWLWDKGRAKPGAAEMLVPASSIKGALKHRMAFHLNCMDGRWTENTTDADEQADPDLESLFGNASDDHAGSGQVGCLVIDDLYCELSPDDVQMVMHNSIDRFTGGVRNRFLFAEEVVHDTGLTLHLTIEPGGVTPDARTALARAIEELCDGRLALGAAASRGLGFFTGTVEWSDAGQWLKQIDDQEAA